MAKWLLLHHSIPREPSASRVYIWRKLKRLGALLELDGVWVLPDTARNAEQFQWLAAEIVELGGEASFWRAEPVIEGQDEALLNKFANQIDVMYRELLGPLSQPERDLEAISRQYQWIRSRDYFDSVIGQQLREDLLAARGVEE